MMTPPARIHADVRRLCRKLGEVDEPVFVEVQARLDSQINDCFIDVERQVEEMGGAAQHGWLIWELPGILIEGEFHAVWRRPDGSLLDVAAKQDGEPRVLFVSDRSRRFEGKRVSTVYHAIGRDPRIKEFIALSARFQRLVAQRHAVEFGAPIIFEDDLVRLRMRMDEIGSELQNSRASRRATE